MMMNHPIKCCCKKISSSVNMVETVILDYMSHHYDPELEDSKPISCMTIDTMAHDDASSCQVWLKKVQQLRRYHQGEHSQEFEIFSVTLTSTTTEQFNVSQDNPAYDDVLSNQV